MAKSRLITTNLLRALDRISQPVYLLGQDQRVKYANSACLGWLRLEADEIKSARCVYTSQQLDDPIENKIRGLSPPPESDPDRGDGFQFEVFFQPEKGEDLQWRNATGHRLLDAAGDVSVIVICSPETRCSRGKEELNSLTSSRWVYDPNELHQALAAIRNTTDLKFGLDLVIGLPSTTRPLHKKIEAAISATADVVIHGPSGTGREHLARTIDAQRRPGSVPPIPLHCAVADQQLIQRNIKELFSNRSGSTGKPIECLLLIDVDQLSRSAQSELWGFLQLPGFEFQTISTSKSSLIRLAQDGKFQSDLASYLTTMEIELQPLRERPNDIPLLAQFFLEDSNHGRASQLAGFSAAAMQLIQQFEWPDNIDQLKRNVMAAARDATGKKIVIEDLPVALRQASQAQEIGQPNETAIILDDYLQLIESQLIARAMQQAKGNKSKAAKLLGISRPKLLRRLQLLKVDGKSNQSQATDQIDSSAFEEADDE